MNTGMARGSLNEFFVSLLHAVEAALLGVCPRKHDVPMDVIRLLPDRFTEQINGVTVAPFVPERLSGLEAPRELVDHRNRAEGRALLIVRWGPPVFCHKKPSARTR